MVALFTSANAQGRALSLDDMMKVEGFGSAVADPTGRWFVFERLRPYDEADDFSFRTYAYKKTGQQLWRYNILHGGDPERLPGLNLDPHSYVLGYSPAGSHMAIMQYRYGDLKLLACRGSGEVCISIGPPPAFSRTGEHNPVWISEDEIAFAASVENVRPALTSVRAHTGRVLIEAWWNAWKGDVATSSAIRTQKRDQSDQQAEGRLVVANANTGQAKVMAQGLYADLRLSPNKKLLASLSVSKPRSIEADELTIADPRKYGLRLFNLKSREERVLAPRLEFFPYSLSWSPDSQRIVGFGWHENESFEDGRFYSVEVQSGKVVSFDHYGLDLVSERERKWRHRPERVMFLGDSIVVYARPIPPNEPQTPRFSFSDDYSDDRPAPHWFALAPDGGVRNLTNGLNGVSGVPLHQGRDQITIMAKDGVYRLFDDGRRISLIPKVEGDLRFHQLGNAATSGSVIRPDFSNLALLTDNYEEGTRLFMLNFSEGHENEVTVFDTLVRNVVPLAGTVTGDAILFEGGSPTGRGLFVTSTKSYPVVKEVARINKHLDGLMLGAWKSFSYEVHDPEGLVPPMQVNSCVLLPPNYTSEAPVPLIVDVYPGLTPNCAAPAEITNPDPNSPYLWAARGYAYAQLALPHELIWTDEGPIAGIDELVLAGVDDLVAQGIADPERLALYGFSQGGVSALYIAAKTRRFKAVIAMNSWADFFSHYFGSSGVYSSVYGMYIGNDSARYDAVDLSAFGIGRTPFEDPEVYYRNSPVFLAPQIDAPVLLIHSDMDGFSMSQFDEMFGALKRSGKEARYVRYWGEGHGPSSPANIQDMWERIDDFLQDCDVAP